MNEVVGDKPIGSPIVAHPKVVVAFNNPSFDKYQPLVKSEGVFIYNKSLIDRFVERNDLLTLGVPASTLAEDAGSIKMMNVVMLGAMLTAYPIITIDQLKQALNEHIPARHRSMLSMNYTAVDNGVEYATQHVRALAIV